MDTEAKADLDPIAADLKAQGRIWLPSLRERTLWYFANPAYEWSTLLNRAAKFWAHDLKETADLQETASSYQTLMQSLRDRRENLRSSSQKLALLNYAVLGALVLSYYGVNIGLSVVGISAADLSKVRDPLLGVSVTLFTLTIGYQIGITFSDTLLKEIIGNNEGLKALYLSDIDFILSVSGKDFEAASLTSIVALLLTLLGALAMLIIYALVFVVAYIIGTHAAFATPSLPGEWSALIGYYAIASLALSLVSVVLIVLWPHRFLKIKLALSARAARRLGKDHSDRWWRDFGGRLGRYERLFYRLRALPRFQSRPSTRSIDRTKRRERKAEIARLRKDAKRLLSELKASLKALKRAQRKAAKRSSPGGGTLED